MIIISYRSPIIIVRLDLISGKAKRIESNIGTRGLPSIVGERPDAALIAAKIVPSPIFNNQNITFFLYGIFLKTTRQDSYIVLWSSDIIIGS